MKKIATFFTVIILPFQFIIAQDCTISGTVKDSISGIGVAYAHIVLDASNNMGGVTDEKGNYKIDKLPYGNYDVKISCLGYKPKTISGITLTSEQKKIKIDALINIDIATLDEVVVATNRPTTEIRPDKKIVYINETEAASGASVADFLVSVPEIKVDGNEVTLKTYAPIILVDGKPASEAMSDLTSVPASLFSSVEVITNPSVRYNPEGLGGIINLKTRKTAEGISGMLQGSANTTNRYNGAGTLNFKTKEWNTFANVYDRYSGEKTTGSLNQQYDSGDLFNQTLSTVNKINRISTRVGTDFCPNDRDVFTIYWEFSKRSGKVNYDNNGEEKYLSTSRTYLSEQKLNLDSRENHIVASYNRTFKNEGELEVYISQTFWEEPTIADLAFKDEDTVTFSDEVLYDKKQSVMNLHYSSPLILKTLTMQTGGFIDLEKINVDDSLSNHFNQGYRNIFDMNRLVGAYYLMLNKRFGKKINISAGGRYEYVNQKLSSVDFKDDNDYYRLYPYLALNYSVKDNIGLSINYGYRVARPDILSLNPYATMDYTYFSERNIGNPNLKPAYTNTIDFGGFYWSEKCTMGVSASYMNTQNDFATVYYSKDSITYSTSDNIATSQKILFNANIDYQLHEIYRPILTLRLGQELYDTPDENSENIHKSFFNWHLSLENIFYLPKDFRVYINAIYYPRTYLYASTTEDRVDLSFRVRKTFKNNFTLQVAFQNILNSNHTENIYGDNFTAKKIMNENPRTVNFGLMYKFGKPIRTRANVNLNLNKIEIE